MSWQSVTFHSSSSLLFPSHLTHSVSAQHLSVLNPSETISKYISIVPPLREYIQPLGLPITVFITAPARATRLEQVFIHLIKILMGCKSQNISMHVFTFHIFDAFIDKDSKGKTRNGEKRRNDASQIQTCIAWKSYMSSHCFTIHIRSCKSVVQPKMNILSFTHPMPVSKPELLSSM